MKVTETNLFRYDRRKLSPGHINASDALAEAELVALEYTRLNISQPGRVMCDCPECNIHGRLVPLHRPEDCTYARERSKLVSEASLIATGRVADPGDGA
jgi:hypothetical protein